MSGTSRPPLSQREFVGLMASCMAMVALSIDLMLPAFPEIRVDLGLASDSTATAWIVTAFFLGLGVGQLVYGPVSDRVGRKPMLYTGLAVMVVAAVAAGFAVSLGMMIACRVLWGIGAAAPRSLALAMIRDAYGGDRMARTMSLVMTTFILVPVLAPSAGAAIMAVTPWRTLFWLPGVAALATMLWARRLPETLPPEHRRSTSPGAMLDAAREVVRTPQTVGFAIALTAIFGIMTGYVAGSELIIDDVFGRGDQFPIIFGALAIFLAGGSFLNSRIVTRLGVHRLLRIAGIYLVAAATLMAVVAVVTDGRPPLLVFGLCMALLLVAVAVIMPNSNTAAMLPLPHVAGTAAALLGTVSTAGGSLLGSVLDARFDGTIGPFSQGVLVYAVLAAAGVFLLGLRAPSPGRRVEATLPGTVPADDSP